MNEINFSETAEEMHAGAADYEAIAELREALRMEAMETAEAMREARGNNGVPHDGAEFIPAFAF